MYYVPDGTQLAGFYECEDCDSRFLNIRIVPRMVCPYCGKAVDMAVDYIMEKDPEAAKAMIDCAEFYLKAKDFDCKKQVMEYHLIDMNN